MLSPCYLVIYSGGTIGMKPGDKGLVPDQQAVTDLLKIYSKTINFDLHICEPLIDSSSVTLEHWSDLIEAIWESQEKYQGVLLIQGTDTMAYTASILSYFLQGFDKPLVITGAQYPLTHKKSDGITNIKHAFYVLTQTPIKEVVLVFGSQVFRGLSVTKIDTEAIDAFIAPYEERVLGLFKDDQFALNKRLFGKELPLGVSAVRKKLNPKIRIATYIFTPGINTELIANSLTRDNTDSAIFLSYGKGNAPDCQKLIDAVTLYIQQGKLIINKSQLLKGIADTSYAQSHALYEAGAIPAGEMTLEHSMAKLLYILS